MRINVITLFPELIQNQLKYLPFRRAIENQLIEINLVNLRDFALDSYGTVDGKPYGGGTGMLLRIEPIYSALKSIDKIKKSKLSKTPKKAKSKILLMSPKGQTYNQSIAEKYKDLEEITIICGRYEGVDERVTQLVDESISIGDFVLSGGELAALAILESTVRLIPGVLEKEDATTIESFSNEERLLEFPQYTRPEDFMGNKVPEVLLSGNHAEIEKWRTEKSVSNKISQE